jgi:N-acetylmuramoyl-L-alanine amidase
MLRKIIEMLIIAYRMFFPAPDGQDGADTVLYDPAIDTKPTPPDPLPVIPGALEPGPAIQPAPFKGTKQVYFIDMGHLEDTKGKQSPVFDDGFTLKEYWANHDTGARLGRYLEEAYGWVEGRDFIFTMKAEEAYDTTYHELLERVNRVSEISTEGKPKFVLSIHFNAYIPGKKLKWTAPQGIETWYQLGVTKSKRAAAFIQSNLVRDLGRPDRGIKVKKEQQKQFFILRKLAKFGITVVLVEGGFFTNKEEAQYIRQATYRIAMAASLANSLAALEGLEPTIEIPGRSLWEGKVY